MQTLIVDDDEFAQGILQSTLGRLGYTAGCAKDGREAMSVLSRPVRAVSWESQFTTALWTIS